MMVAFGLQQADYLDFVASLGFLVVAAVCLALYRQSQRRLVWLALGLFALSQGLARGLAVLSQSAVGVTALTAPQEEWQVVESTLLALLALSITLERPAPSRRISFPLLLVGATAVSVLWAVGAKAWLALWVLHAGLGIAAAGTLWAQSRGEAVRCRRCLRGGATLLGLYMVVGGVTVRPTEVYRASPELAPALLGSLLAQTVVAALLAVSLSSYREALLTSSNDVRYRAGRGWLWWGTVASLLVILVLGWVATYFAGAIQDRSLRRDLLSLTMAAAAALPTQEMAALSAGPADLAGPAYRHVRRALMGIRLAHPTCRFAYLMALRNGEVVFLADSEPENSPDWSPPGQAYVEASDLVWAALREGRPAVEGPTPDRWGIWVSALAPVYEPDRNRILAVFGIDIDAADWANMIGITRLAWILLTAALGVLVMGFCVAMLHRADFTEQIAGSERRYRALVEGSPNCVALFNAEGQLLSINTHGLEMMGQPEAELLGRPLPDLLCPCVREQAEAALAAVQGGLRHRFEAVCPRPDGTLSAWEVTLNPLTDEEGRTRQFVAIAMDVTERKRYEQRLQDTVRHLSAVNEMARALASTLNHDRLLRIVLQEVSRVVPGDWISLAVQESGESTLRLIAIRGIDEEDAVVGCNAVLDFQPEDLEEVFATRSARRIDDLRACRAPAACRLAALGLRSFLSVPVVSDHLTIGCVNVARRQAGTFSASEQALLESLTSHVAAALSNARAYQQLRVARAELEQAQEQVLRVERLRSIGEVAQGVAHDFNNLLSVVLSRTQMLLRDEKDPDRRKSLEIVEAAARDGRDTVRRIQGFASRNDEEAFEAVNLDQVVEEALAMTSYRWRDAAEREGRTITVETMLGSAPWVQGNPAELRQVLINMIYNACDAMPEGGCLSIRTGREAGWGRLVVADTGVGMDEETLARAFGLFFTTKGPGNTGLGLSISQGIIQRHGGRIEVQSRVGEGTVFTVSLPLAESRAEHVEASPEGTHSAHLRVLVVDDDATVLAALQEAVRTLGHEAASAPSGVAALQMVATQPFDLVITDLGMPGMSGWQVAEEVKRLAPQTQVVILTGWGDTVENSRHVEETLTKPVELRTLQEVMARVQARRAA